MCLVCSSLFCATVLVVFCQSHPSSSTYSRHERSIEIPLPRIVVISKIIDNRYNHGSLNTNSDRARRDVPASSYHPTFPAPYRPPPQMPARTFPPLPIPAQYAKDVASENPLQDDDYNGNFNYNFEAENGINIQVKGYPKTLDNGEVVQAMEGQYSYTAPDGTPINTKWFADETGFHAEGAHIPGSKGQ